MFSTGAAGSSEEGVKLVKESENESGSAVGCVGPSGRPSDWLSESLVKLLDVSEHGGTTAVLLSPFGSAGLFSGTWAKRLQLVQHKRFQVIILSVYGCITIY